MKTSSIATNGASQGSGLSPVTHPRTLLAIVVIGIPLKRQKTAAPG